ncbi:MAG: malonyl-ACP O-methyltransferase BioC [Burkholderiales bacterium]|nr:malonyl-ACP O-methyltransferase BioC [Burkholderiales bacterium]
MDDAHAIDKGRARRAFERAAAGYDAAAVLQDEVCRRMLARLEYIRIDPALILDAGCGTGNAIPGLAARYPRARVLALDLALAMARRARARGGGWRALAGLRGAAIPVCGDIERLPLAAASADLVWSNLALQWTNEPARAFAEAHRVLRPGGLLMFSTFGPDTLKELRAAYLSADARVHVHRFVDMHDIGDMLVRAGYADPVMDMERLTLTYASARELMRDLKAIGATNAARGRPAGLTGRALLAAVERSYEAQRRDGRLPASFEALYGHAWKPAPRLGPSGRPVIDIKRG